MKSFHVRAIFGLLLLVVMMMATGCSSTMSAVKNRNLAVDVRMSDSIFLDAETLTGTESPKVFVRVANTSGMQDLDFKKALADKLTEYGYTVTGNAREATYLVTANVLYMGEASEGANPQAALTAGFGGAVLGMAAAGAGGSSFRHAGAAGLVAGAAIAGTELAVGAIWHVDEYFGVIDLEIKEAVEGGVSGVQTASVTDGASTVSRVTRNVKSDRQTYRTRIVATAKQTRMDRAEAVGILNDKLATQTAGYFKL